jgi:hypothetical protein
VGRRTVHVSDFSGTVLQPGDEVVRVVVLEHPDLVTGPVQVEATPKEIETIDDASLDVVVVEIYDGDQPRRVTLTAHEFDELATDAPMAQVLKMAERVAPARKAPPPKIDYSTFEHAGKPHRGKITVEEAQLVRDRLEEINKRLADDGLRQIDPGDPEHAERYGFPAAVLES